MVQQTAPTLLGAMHTTWQPAGAQPHLLLPLVGQKRALIQLLDVEAQLQLIKGEEARIPREMGTEARWKSRRA